MAEGKREVVLYENRMNLAQHIRNVHVVDAEVGTTIQDILKPGYWSMVAQHKLRLYDRIEVTIETGEWMAELLVLETDRSWAKVKLLHLHELKEAVAENAPGEPPREHAVEWKGRHHGFVVIRLSDQQAIQSGFKDKSAAYEWLKNFERVAA